MNRQHHASRQGGGKKPLAQAFSLVELLVTVSIIALLLSILLPAFSSARESARSFVCMDHIRAAAFEFRLFTDPYSAGHRGESEGLGNRFRAIDFLEKLYEVDEFWPIEGQLRPGWMPYAANQKPIICPSGPRGLMRIHGAGAAEILFDLVSPKEKISFALNRRLFSAPVTIPGLGIPSERPVTIGQRVLDHPNVPLLFDADARPVAKKYEGGFFSAPPPQNEPGPSTYDNDKYWYPSLRHNKRISVAFVGGHVVSTEDPLADASWDWDYHPAVPSP